MKTTKLMVAILCAASLALAGCESVTGWYNKPETQQQITQIEQTAFNILVNWLTGFKGGAVAKLDTQSPAVQSKINQLTERFQREHPGLRAADVRAAVEKATAEAVAQRKATLHKE